MTQVAGVMSRGVRTMSPSDIDLLFEQMRGEATAQGLHRYAFVEFGRFGRSGDGAIELARRQRIRRIRAWKHLWRLLEAVAVLAQVAGRAHQAS